MTIEALGSSTKCLLLAEPLKTDAIWENTVKLRGKIHRKVPETEMVSAMSAMRPAESSLE